MPTVGNFVVCAVTTVSGAAVGGYVTVSTLGTLQIGGITTSGSTSLSLQNNGSGGNAASGTIAPVGSSVVSSGPPGPSGTTGVNAYATTSGNFTQPAVSSSVTVSLIPGATWMAVGQPVYIATGGLYTVSSTTSTSAVLTNTGAVGNASPGATVSSGAQVTPSGLTGPAGTSGVTWAADLAGSSSSSQTVVALSSASVIPVSGPGFSAPSTSGTAGQDFVVTPQQSTNGTTYSGGNFRITTQVPNAGGVEGQINVYRGSSGQLSLGPWPGSPSSYASLYLGTLSTLGSGAAALISNVANTYVNGSTSVSVYISPTYTALGTLATKWTQTSLQQSLPIIGDGSSSPYALNGYVSIALVGSITLTAAQYANRFLVFTGTGSYTVTLPNLPGYDRVIRNSTTGTLTVQCGTGATTLAIANSKTATGFCDGSNDFYRITPDT